jgi:hypothetical protein
LENLHLFPHEDALQRSKSGFPAFGYEIEQQQQLGTG